MKKTLYNLDWSTPTLVLNCKLGGLAIIRTLGAAGVAVYGVDDDEKNPILKSRYLKKSFVKSFNKSQPEEYLDYVIALATIIGEKAVLIPTSDDLAIFVAEYRERLDEHFLFAKNDGELLDRLADKQKMFDLALENDVPTPHTISPKNAEDVQAALKEITYPIMLKGIDGNRLLAYCGRKMMIVNNEEELLENYEIMEDKSNPNLMFQELIPGDDDQVYIFNGYFNKNSDCLAAFTGHKVRQFPVHVGCASLGECRWHERVAEKTQRLMKAVGYQGILDIGYRLDPRDDKYKVLDINPRVGQAFRIFVAQNNMDVVRALYIDLTGQEMPEVKPIEGRRWVIEDYDIISSFDYYRENTLGFMEWIKSFKSLREGAWFCWKDPLPFLIKMTSFFLHGIAWAFRQVFSSKK